MNLPSSTQDPLAIAIARVWLTFSLVAFDIAVLASIFDGDHPLRSDDPYIVGCLVGGACALFSFVKLIARAFGVASSLQAIAYFVPLVFMAGFLIVWDLFALSPEGSGLGIMFGSAIGGFGLLAFAIQIWPLNRLRIAAASVPGIFFLCGYAYVCLIYFPSQ